VELRECVAEVKAVCATKAEELATLVTETSMDVTPKNSKFWNLTIIY
jgi:hypothetical protein